MSVDERRQRLHRKLQEVLGPESAAALMDELGTTRLTAEDLRREFQAAETRMDARFRQMDIKLELLEERNDRKLAELKADLLHTINEQTKTLFRAAVVSNAASVLAVGGLAFGAARLA